MVSPAMFVRQVLQALVLLGLAMSVVAHPAPVCLATPVFVRFPPTIQNDSKTHWAPPPLGWDFGNWIQTNSSTSNPWMRNLQYSSTPVDPHHPAGDRNDLSSFQLLNNDTVYTSYGVDTPTSIPAVYSYASTGVLQGANDTLEVLAWGYDCHGVAYRISYSTLTSLTQTPASIDVLSRTDKGPDSVTLSKIQHALVAFGDATITALAESISPAVQDGGRDGQPPIETCDDTCKSNSDLIGLF
jgi:hypothetical protein